MSSSHMETDMVVAVCNPRSHRQETLQKLVSLQDWGTWQRTGDLASWPSTPQRCWEMTDHPTGRPLIEEPHDSFSPLHYLKCSSVLGSGVHCGQVTFGDIPASSLTCEAPHGRVSPLHLMALAQPRAGWPL